MLFKREHIPMILNGTKTATRRIWKKPRVKEGRIYKCKNKMLSKEYFALIKVNKIYKQFLGEMGDKDAIKEGYADLEAFKEIWIKINGFWHDNCLVDVIEFEIVK